MNIIAGVLVFCAMPLVLALVARVATASSRNSRRPWVSFLGAGGCVAALLLVPAFWINRNGTPIEGMLAGKSEDLHVSDTGLILSVSRRFTLTIADPSAQVRFAHWPIRGDLELDVDEQRFDYWRVECIGILTFIAVLGVAYVVRGRGR